MNQASLESFEISGVSIAGSTRGTFMTTKQHNALRLLTERISYRQTLCLIPQVQAKANISFRFRYQSCVHIKLILS